VVGLWALHNEVLGACYSATGRKCKFRPSGCWAVSYGQKSMIGEQASPQALTRVVQVPSRGAAALERIAVDIAHEIAHMIYTDTVAWHKVWPTEVKEYEAALWRVLGEMETSRACEWHRVFFTALPEVFADTFAVVYFFQGDTVPFFRRVAELLRSHTATDGIQLVLRAFVQYWRSELADRQALEDALLAPRTQADFQQYLRDFEQEADRHALLQDQIADLFEHLKEQEDLAALLDDALQNSYDLAQRAAEDSRKAERPAQLTEAFHDLLSAAANDPLSARIRFCETLWCSAHRALSEPPLSPWQGIKSPGLSPWAAVLASPSEAANATDQ